MSKQKKGKAKAAKGRAVVKHADQAQPKQVVDRSSFSPAYPFAELEFGLTQIVQSLTTPEEHISPGFLSFVQEVYQSSPIVFACVWNRMALFREGRFQWRERRNGRPGNIFGNTDLQLLEKPWPRGSTGDLLALAEVTVSCAGNFLAAKRDGRLRVMRPDWTRVLLGSEQDENVTYENLDADVLAYLYYEGGMLGQDPIILDPAQVIHYAPIKHPVAWWMGMSWMTPVIQEISADKGMTGHRKKFLEAGATPNYAVKINVEDLDLFTQWVDKYEEERDSKGGNPYRTLFLGAVADVVPIGTNFRDLDFNTTQSGGEVRIAAAAGVHPTVAAFWAGLQGSALNAGNFEAAYRQFGNGTIRPLWDAMAEACQQVLPVPVRSDAAVELWVDDRDVPAMAEDSKKAAEVSELRANMISTFVTAGFTPESSVEAVMTDDLTRLVHSGRYSVQLLPPDSEESASDPSTNGSGNPARIPAPA